jgi:DNA sulfur modification protein DndD
MLVNNPNIKERKILRCECKHRRVCNLCRRRTDASADREGATLGGMNG